MAARADAQLDRAEHALLRAVEGESDPRGRARQSELREEFLPGLRAELTQVAAVDARPSEPGRLRTRRNMSLRTRILDLRQQSLYIRWLPRRLAQRSVVRGPQRAPEEISAYEAHSRLNPTHHQGRHAASESSPRRRAPLPATLDLRRILGELRKRAPISKRCVFSRPRDQRVAMLIRRRVLKLRTDASSWALLESAESQGAGLLRRRE